MFAYLLVNRVIRHTLKEHPGGRIAALVYTGVSSFESNSNVNKGAQTRVADERFSQADSYQCYQYRAEQSLGLDYAHSSIWPLLRNSVRFISCMFKSSFAKDVVERLQAA